MEKTTKFAKNTKSGSVGTVSEIFPRFSELYKHIKESR